MSLSSEISPSLLSSMERNSEELTVATPPAPPAATAIAGSQWDLPTKRTVLVILLVVAVLVFWISRSVLSLLIISGIVAYLLSPIVDFCERLRIPRAVSTIVLFALGFVGLILLPVFLVPVLLQQLETLGDFDVNRTASIFLRWLTVSLQSLPESIQLLGITVPIGYAIDEIEQNFQQVLTVPTLAEILGYIQQVLGTATTVVGSTALFGLSVVGGIVQVLLTFFITFFLSLYMTKDAPVIRAYVQSLFPISYQSELGDLMYHISHIWQAFFRGQLVLCIIIGVLTWGALELVGMPGALILGILAGTLEIIPSLGPTLSMLPAVIVALIQGSDVLAVYGISNFGFALITVAIYFIIQQMENSIIVPRVIGSSVNLHPVVVICGVAVGFNVGGIGGAFLAAPIIASFRVLGGYVHAKLLDYPPFQNLRPPNRAPRRPLIYRRTVKGDELHSPAPSARPAAASVLKSPRTGSDTA